MPRGSHSSLWKEGSATSVTQFPSVLPPRPGRALSAGYRLFTRGRIRDWVGPMEWYVRELSLVKGIKKLFPLWICRIYLRHGNSNTACVTNLECLAPLQLGGGGREKSPSSRPVQPGGPQVTWQHRESPHMALACYRYPQVPEPTSQLLP